MMPDNALSQVSIRYLWYGPPQDDPDALVDYDLGGVALNNTSKGLMYQVWTYEAVGSSAFVSASNTAGRILLFTVSTDIEQIRGTFDQNMNPMVAYKQSGQWHYWWFDTISGTMVVSDLPVGVDSVVVTLDDKRQLEATGSDVLLFYTLNNNLYHRRQRDRYTTDFLLRAGIGGTLVRADMNGINRLQIKLRTK